MVGLVVISLAFKLGATPIHAWLPDAAHGAPAPVATLVLAAPKVGASIAAEHTAVPVAYYVRVLVPVHVDAAPQRSPPVLGHWAAYGVVLGAAAFDAIGIWAEPILPTLGRSERAPV